jgi:hypothetical protein
VEAISHSIQPSMYKLKVDAASSEGKKDDCALLVNSIEEVARGIIYLLNPHRLYNASPHVVICWDGSNSLIDPYAPWTTFSELQHALRTIKWLPFISIFLSTRGMYQHYSPTPKYHTSSRLMYGTHDILPPITEVCFFTSLPRGWTTPRKSGRLHALLLHTK